MSDVSLRSAVVALVCAIGATTANAADYSPPPPPCVDAALIASGRAPAGSVPCYVPPVVEEFSSWYLRGDIGMSNQQIGKLTNPAGAGLSMVSSSYGFDSAPILGLGIGYYFNDWARFDLTGEYRGRSNFHGSENYALNGGYSTDEYSGSKSEWLLLANAYIDLGTWNNFTPFVGAGVGFARIGFSNWQDVCHSCGGNPANNGISFAGDTSKWNFAWALHAGVSYKVSKNFAVELSYRYLDMGKATTGSWVAYDFSETLPGSTADRLTSHDIRLGLRMNFDAFTSRSYSPVVYSPQPSPVSVYAQAPPTYMQPAQTYQQPATTYAQPAPVYAPQPNYSQPGYAQPTYAQPSYGGYAPRH